MLRTIYTPNNNYINVSIPNKYVGMELEILVFPINEISTCKADVKTPTEKNYLSSKSMQRALDDEKKGRITKLVNHKNAVAEILG